jgi:hypothetical protein
VRDVGDPPPLPRKLIDAIERRRVARPHPVIPEAVATRGPPQPRAGRRLGQPRVVPGPLPPAVHTPRLAWRAPVGLWRLARLVVARGGRSRRSSAFPPRIVGIGLACLSMVIQFMFIPHYPIWSLLVIALDAVIIWGLATYRPDAV